MNDASTTDPVVIIGGGTSGAVLAARLSNDPDVDVVLIEAGPDHDYGSEILDPARAAAIWLTGTNATSLVMKYGDGSIPMVQGRILGGTSAINYLATVRGQPDDYDAWASAGCVGWGWHDVRADFVAAETDLDFGADELHGDSGPLTVRRWRRDQFSRSHTAFFDGMKSVGLPVVSDVNDPAALPGIGVFPATVDEQSGERLTTSTAYLSTDVRARPNLSVVTSAEVVEIIVDEGTARGVRLADSSTLAASEVIVCAGAIATPALLQRSGIGPAALLRGFDIGCHADLPVGRTLSDHLGPVIPYRHDGPAGGDGGPAQSVLVGASDGRNVDFHMFPTVTTSNDDETQLTMLTFLLRSSGLGSVSLSGPGVDDVPEVVAPPLPEGGLDRLSVALGHLADWEESEPARSIDCTAIDPLDLRAADAVERALDRWTMSYGHMVGTCPMGPVLDNECRVHGIANLRVADASAMPSIPAGNTYLGCVMIAERVARFVLASRS